MVTTPYAGHVDLNPLHIQFGETLEPAGELGFMLTYHVAQGGNARMTLTGRGITQALLVQLLRDALEANAEHGYTT